jgi:hypothetical protein
LNRLQEWQKCLAFCIEEKEGKIETMKSGGERSLPGAEESEEGPRRDLKSKHSRHRYETELPLSRAIWWDFSGRTASSRRLVLLIQNHDQKRSRHLWRACHSPWAVKAPVEAVLLWISKIREILATQKIKW